MPGFQIVVEEVGGDPKAKTPVRYGPFSCISSARRALRTRHWEQIDPLTFDTINSTGKKLRAMIEDRPPHWLKRRMPSKRRGP